MASSIELKDRLYEAVLELTMIPRSQLDMLLSSPDSVSLNAVLRSLIMCKAVADEWDSMEREAGRPCRRRTT
jgi:hypothetical protein